jgi:Glyoxalase-like domain
MFSRRTFLAFSAALASRLHAAPPETPPLFDHMLLACGDLDKGIAFVEEKLGVRAAFGGVHPGRGSRNALLALGGRRYLEVIGPDPSQPQHDDTRELYKIASPHLIGWAVHVDDASAISQRLTAGHVAFDPVRDGSRKRPSGQMLSWKALSLHDDRGGLLPFYIEWSKDSPHPSSDAPSGCTLASFELVSPDDGALRSLASKVGVEVTVAKGPAAALRAKIDGPKGTLSL